MPGSFLAKYLPSRRQTDSFMMNGGIHHAGGNNKNSGHKASDATNITSGSSMDDPETPCDQAQIKFLPRTDSQRAARGVCRQWSTKEKYLLLLSAFLFLLCVAFVFLAFTRDLQLRDQLAESSKTKVCSTKACVSTAAQLMAGMDFTADPCEDFFQYACGQWNRKHVIPEDKPTFNKFDNLHDELQIILRDLLERPQSAADSNATVKAKLLYKSCMNQSMIGDRGDKPVRNLITELGGWPVIDDQWSSSGFVLEDMLSKIRGKYEAPYLFNIGVGADDKNSTANIIQIDQATLGMPSREYYMHRNQAHLQAYVRFMSDVVRLMGATGPDVTSQLNDLLDFETKLANVTKPQDERHDTGALYKKMTVKELQEHLPRFDVLRYLRGFIQDPITEDEPIVVFALQYLKDVVDIVEETEPRTVANYIIWRVVQHFVEYLDESFQEARSLYKQVFQGVKQDLIRWKRCVEIVNENVGMATGAMFVRDNFKKQSKDTALEMIHNIREAFNELLEENEWMDGKTREVAKEKANAMNERIGYPEFITDPEQLDAKYERLNFTGDQFFDNILSVLEFETRRSLDRLRKEVRKDVWEQEPVVVNAFYNPNTNDIVFPAGILQPSFYSQSYPKSLNYGGIGVVIGHEITHGFDDKGRQYDKNGNIKLWWDDKTIEAFRKRAQCVIEQYSGFKLEQINEYINGKITQGENIADNGGLKQAYRAYRKWVEHNGEEPELPGLGLSHNQLFFLNYAQIWCGKTRDEEALRKSRISVHSPGSIRVLGPLSNSREFSAAYSCPLGSRMNPEHKCSVW